MADLKLGFVKPVGADNVVVEGKYVKGSYLVVATTSERDGLLTEGQEAIVEGSLCYCQADDKFYIYTGSAWVEKTFGETYTAGTGITIDANNAINNDVSPLVPAQATSSNQLADKAFVNSSIENMAAFYVTTRTGSGTEEDPYVYGPFATKSALNSTQTVYINKEAKTPGKNDYAVVLADESQQGSLANAPTTRYMYPKSNTEPYDPTAWEFQYIINNTGLTAAQLAALNSGITAQKVATYDGYAAQIASKSTVTASSTGTSTTEAKFITIDNTEYKLGGGYEDSVRYGEAQTLTDAQKLQARTNIGAQESLPSVTNDRYLHTNASTGALEWTEVSSGTGAVRYDEAQTLTSEQQAQAQSNIGLEEYTAAEIDALWAAQ